jgi:hypothetical protein
MICNEIRELEQAKKKIIHTINLRISGMQPTTMQSIDRDAFIKALRKEFNSVKAEIKQRDKQILEEYSFVRFENLSKDEQRKIRGALKRL